MTNKIIPHQPTFNTFVRRMNPLIVRARAGERGLEPELRAIEEEYEAKKAEGWIDWESEVGRHLKALRRWVERAESA